MSGPREEGRSPSESRADPPGGPKDPRRSVDPMDPEGRLEETAREPRRRFFLATDADPDEPRLAPEEARHAGTVLRLRSGEPVLGIDGKGRAWPLTIRNVERGEVQVAPAGPPWTEPEPGSPGAPAPDLRIAFSMPQTNRLEALVDRLVQIGATRLAPFTSKYTPARSRTLNQKTLSRLQKIARSGCKQSHRLWEPELEPLRSLEELLATVNPAATARLDPRATRTLRHWADTKVAAALQSFTLIIGPEGGFAASDTDSITRLANGIETCWLAPYVLRIETAAEMAAGILIHTWRDHPEQQT